MINLLPQMVPGRVSVWRDPPTTDTHTVSVSNGQPTTPALVKVTLEESQFSVSLKSQLLLVISATFVNSEESTSTGAACKSRGNCTLCHDKAECGWCDDTSGTGTGTCHPGSFPAPSTAQVGE